VDGEFSEEEIFPDRIVGARHFFTDKVYGKVPTERPKIETSVIEEGPVIDSRTGNQIAYRKQLAVRLSRAGKSITVKVLINAPTKDGRFPMLLSPNIYGNHSVTSDPNVLPSNVFSISPRYAIPFKEEHRGAKEDRFNLREIVSRGFAAVTYSYDDIVPDTHPKPSDTGAYGLYPELLEAHQRPGAIAMWAWSMPHIAHAVSDDPMIDPEQMSVMGFSRLGKAVHLALAHENPFKAGIAVASGKAGAAPLKSGAGEPSALMAALFSYWYRPGFLNIVARLRKIPYGQKHLLAMSDVPVLVSVDETDWWSAPELQEKTVASANRIRIRRGQSPTHEFITHRVGGHTVSRDWDSYIDFLKRHLHPERNL
jgi:dienelactone hydrolase